MFSGKIAPGDCRCSSGSRENKKDARARALGMSNDERRRRARARGWVRRGKKSARGIFHTGMQAAAHQFSVKPINPLSRGASPKTQLSTADERDSDAHDTPLFSGVMAKNRRDVRGAGQGPENPLQEINIFMA